MIWVLSFLILILGIFFSKIKFSFKKIKLKVINNKLISMKFEVNFTWYLFGIIKIFSIKFLNDGLRLYKFFIPYSKLKMNDNFKSKILKNFRKYDKKIILEELKLLNLRTENCNINLLFSTEDVAITSIATFLTSIFLSVFLQKTIKKYNPQKYKFIITPKYDMCNNIILDLTFVVSFKLRNLLKLLIKLKNYIKTNNKLPVVIKNKKDFWEYV